jgi:hypothetical protein
MKPFALWSPHVAASYDTQFLSFDATSTIWIFAWPLGGRNQKYY